MGGEMFMQQSVLLLLVPLYAFGFYGLLRLFVRGGKEGTKGVNWSPLESVGITISLYFLGQLFAVFAMALFMSLIGRSLGEIDTVLSDSTFAQFVYIALVEAATLGILFWFMHRRRTSWRSIGLVRPRWKDIGYSLGGFVVYFASYVLLATLVASLVPQLNLEQKQELGFSTDTAGGGIFLVFISLVILPPLVEEILCRGFLYSGLRNKLRFIPAAIITSILFAAAHLQAGSGNALLWVAALDTFTLSLVLVYLREKTGSLWPSIGLHMMKNLIAFLTLFVFQAG